MSAGSLAGVDLKFGDSPVPVASTGAGLFGSFTVSSDSTNNGVSKTDEKKHSAAAAAAAATPANGSEPFVIPKSYPGAMRAGAEYALRSDHKTAIACFTAAISFVKSKTETEPFIGRAGSRFAISDFAGALQDWNAVLGTSSATGSGSGGGSGGGGGEPEWYRDRGLVHSALGNLDAAINDLNRAIDLEPDFVNFYVARAKLYRDRSRKSAAIATAAAGAAADTKQSNSSPAVTAPATATTGSGGGSTGSTGSDDLSKSIADYTYVLDDLREDDACDALIGRAECYSALLHYDKAITDLNKAELSATESWRSPPAQLLPLADVLERRAIAIHHRLTQLTAATGADAKKQSAEVDSLTCRMAMDWDAVHAIRSVQPDSKTFAASIAVAKSELDKALTAGGWSATNCVTNARAERAKNGFAAPAGGAAK